MSAYKYTGAILLSALLLACGGSEPTAEQNEPETVHPGMTKGKAIFAANCIQCHSLHRDQVGPKLEGAMSRWNNDTARITRFIKNSQEAINMGDPRAIDVYEKWNKTIMTPMPHLTDKDVIELIDYINKGVE